MSTRTELEFGYLTSLVLDAFLARLRSERTTSPISLRGLTFRLTICVIGFARRLPNWLNGWNCQKLQVSKMLARGGFPRDGLGYDPVDE